MEYFTKIPSPVGTLTLTANEEGLTGLWMHAQPSGICADDFSVFADIRLWLEDYFLSKQPSPADLPLRPAGTPFQKRVWQILLTIPYGESRSYGDIAREIAKQLGRERMSAQAIGGAVGRNPISIIIPCHRVLGARKQLTGYAGGLEIKKQLLRHEKISFLEDSL